MCAFPNSLVFNFFLILSGKNDLRKRVYYVVHVVILLFFNVVHFALVLYYLKVIFIEVRRTFQLVCFCSMYHVMDCNMAGLLGGDEEPCSGSDLNMALTLWV